jgi:hypothetical protein
VNENLTDLDGHGADKRSPALRPYARSLFGSHANFSLMASISWRMKLQ